MTQEEQKKLDEALIEATVMDDLSGMEEAIRGGAKIDALNVYGLQPMHIAAAHGTESTLELLLRNGAKVDAADPDGEQPVHRAALHGRREVLGFLFRNGSRIDAAGGNGWQPLHCAASMGCADAVGFLLENGADPMAKDARERMPLELVGENYPDVRNLLEKWSAPDFRAARTVREHWKRMAGRLQKPGPRM